MSESIDTSLVRIHTKAGGVAGAGFLVGTRHILTCAHVIADALGLSDGDALHQPASTVSLDFPQIAFHTLLTAKVIFWDAVQSDGRGDIAGLELLDEPPVGAQAVQFAPADQVWDHSFRALGFPQGFDEGVWATGRLLGRQGTNWIQIEDVKIPGIAVISGFSGAPVWDTQLEGVIGMVVAASQQATAKTAFVIPTDVLIAAWQQLATLMRPPVPRNPYKGLNAFTENDSSDFFGRAKLIEELATAVDKTLTREQKEDQHARLLAVLGASGSGKSSVVKAGLLPSLRAGGVFNSKEWIYLDPIFPGAHPLETLAVSLAKQLPARGPVSLHKDLSTDSPRSLHMLTCQLVASSQQKVVLIVDQFEEVFTLTTDEDERKRFFELLVKAVTEQDGPLFVILTLRADFYDRPMHYPELFRLIDDHHVSVLPLDRDDLRAVIERPASLPEVQLTFEKGLVDELLFDMQGQSGALPMLEFTLDQLFQRRSGHQLTLQAYREMGGVKGALSQHAEETYQKLTPEQQKAARDIFLRLIEPGTNEQDATRHRATRSEFESADPIEEQRMRETLEAFYKARLLTTNQIGSTITIEVSHEALIREWTTLSEWLRKASNDIHFQRSLSEDVEEWEQRKRPGDRLYRGAQLKEAQNWVTRNRPNKQEAAFLRASATQRILARVGVIVLALLLLSLMGITGWYLFFQPDKTLVTTLQDDAVGSLRWCVNNAPSGSTIGFAQSLRGTVKLTVGALVFAGGKRLTISGPGANQLTISGGKTNSYIDVSVGATVKFSNLSFKNSKQFVDAFLYNEGTLTVTNSIISDNVTLNTGDSSYGGGIYNADTGTLTVTNSIISDNKLTAIGGDSYGGGIENVGTLTVTNSTFSNNSASGDSNGEGGGIYNDGKLTVTHSTFSNNSASSSNATGFGGGIDNYNTGTLTLTEGTFSGNSVSGKQKGEGGGIYNDGKLAVTQSTFSGNSAIGSGVTGFGGGIDNYKTGTVMVTTSNFSNNSASGKQNGQGGGIDNDGNLTVVTSTLSNNTASGKQNGFGGGIFSFGLKGASAVIRFSTIYGNTSGAGGGIWVDSSGSSHMTISSSIIAANSADESPEISGALTSGGYNLIQDDAGATVLNTSTDKHVALADLNLDHTLAKNGGLTQSLKLLQGSKAIDAVPQQACSITVTDASGQNVTINTDQRGQPRPDGPENTCDIGAYESSY